jgi:hypothetical protein
MNENILIANFLGIKISEDNLEFRDENGFWQPIDYLYSSWNWIMLTAEIINSLPTVSLEIKKNYSRIKVYDACHPNNMAFTRLSRYKKYGGMRNAVYRNIIEFIKYTNGEEKHN